MAKCGATGAKKQSGMSRYRRAYRKRLLSSLISGKPGPRAQTIAGSNPKWKYLGERVDPAKGRQNIVFETSNGVLVNYDMFTEDYVKELKQRFPRMAVRRFPRLKKSKDGKYRFPRSSK